MHPIFLLEHISLSDRHMGTALLEGLFAIMETTESVPSIDYVLGNIDHFSYSDCLSYLTKIFDVMKYDPEKYEKTLNYFGMHIWTMYKTISDGVKQKLETFPDIEFIKYTNAKKKVNEMLLSGNQDSEIIAETGDNDLIRDTIKEEKANQLLHRVKDMFMPKLKELMIK